MNHLEDRIRSLETRAARSARLIAALGLLALCAVTVAATGGLPGHEVLRSQRVEIIDGRGNTVAVLGSDDTGGFLSISRTGGPPVTILGADSHGGFVTVRSETGVPVSILAADRDGGYVTVRNREGVPVLIGQTTEFGGVLQIRDDVGTPVAVIRAEGEGARFRVWGDDGGR